MRLSVKFSLVISSLLFITIALMVFININQNKSFLQNEIKKKGQTLAQTAAISCLDPLLKKDFATLRRYCNSIADDEDVLSISILGTDYIVKMNNDIRILGESWSEKVTHSPTPYDMIKPISLADKIIGYVFISMTDRNIQDELKTLIGKNIFLGFGFTLIGIAFALLMAKRITTPLNALTDFASRVSDGNFQILPEYSSSDEVGILSRAFNLMITNLIGYIDARTRDERLTMAGKLSAVIAHEIRNPLEPIKGAVTMLRMKNPDDQWIKKYTTIIDEEVGALSDFIENFLDFTKSGEPKFRRLNINNLIGSIKDLSEEYIKQHNNNLVLVLDSKIRDSYFDPNQIKQILMNLILNSVQAMEDEEGELVIKTRMDRTENGEEVIKVTVRDNGTGIQPEVLKKLFEPYFTSKDQGTGLGLFISQLLIEKHGGTLTVESKYGEWTEVTINIPFKGDLGDKL